VVKKERPTPTDEIKQDKCRICNQGLKKNPGEKRDQQTDEIKQDKCRIIRGKIKTHYHHRLMNLLELDEPENYEPELYSPFRLLSCLVSFFFFSFGRSVVRRIVCGEEIVFLLPSSGNKSSKLQFGL
jgi:hypothetical protein